MKLHELKILEQYARPKAEGKKPFEIRKNDRNYAVGDIVHYNVVADNRRIVTSGESRKTPEEAFFEDALYEITYITDYEQKEGYVVFGEKRIK